jgi:hypothetical protein
MRKAIGFMTLAASVACSASALADPTITEFDAPGAHSTHVYGIGNGGDITGVYVLENGAGVGFVRKSDGSFVSFDQPTALPQAVNANGETTGYLNDASDNAFFAGADGTVSAFLPPDWGRFYAVANAIDAKGNVAGDYYDTHLISRGFVRNRGGHIVTFDAPGTVTKIEKGTFVTGLAANGTASGYVHDDTNTFHSFLRARDGTFTAIDIAGAGAGAEQGTRAPCMSANGAVGGYYKKSRAAAHGFLRDSAGNFTLFDVRHVISTVVNGVNSKGFAVGYYVMEEGPAHGFERLPSGHIVRIDAPDAGTAPDEGTVAVAINDRGEVAGYYSDSAGNQHGFFRTK